MSKPTDADLYELAGYKTVNNHIDVVKISSEELKRLLDLRDAVRERFKPREPRVIERWVIVRKHGMPLVFEDINSIPDLLYGDYLAKAVVTEVMDD